MSSITQSLRQSTKLRTLDVKKNYINVEIRTQSETEDQNDPNKSALLA